MGVSSPGGLEVLQQLQQDPVHSLVPVVILSVNAEPRQVAHGLNVGAADYITKPFDPVVLGARVERVLTLLHR